MNILMRILIVFIVLFVMLGVIFLMAENDSKRTECLRTISDDFCKEKQLLSRVKNMAYFYCIEEERSANGKEYMFTPEEVNSCQSFGERRTEA